ncbi:MAG: RluA family pseudouridine synthase [Erysipelotrichaceae bacterium]
MYSIKIEELETRVRIDKYLASVFDLSRTYIQECLDQGLVQVNGVVCKANYRVSLNDEIVLTPLAVKELNLTPVDLNLDIVYEDSDVIVVNKPRHLVVHPSAGHYEETLVHGLLHHCKDLSGINGVNRPGIVHRIDKDTSGLLVVCKNDKAHQAISDQLKDKTCTRTYVALVHGDLPHEFGTIDAPIGRDPKDRQKMCVTNRNSKEAVTYFKVLKKYEGYTLVQCTLKTGRTHQIRVHMQYIKHPIVGDFKYSYKNTMSTNGQLLHAMHLAFDHPTTNERMHFDTELPSYFQDVLDSLTEVSDESNK